MAVLEMPYPTAKASTRALCIVASAAMTDTHSVTVRTDLPTTAKPVQVNR